MKFSTLFCFLLLIITAKSQNLVPNPGFEIYYSCPDDITLYSIKKIIPGWQLPTRGTSDYFNQCAIYQVGIPQNFIGNLYAFEGKAYVGIVLLEKPPQNDTSKYKLVNYREYLQAELYEPLKAGKKYSVSLQYAIANYSTYATTGLGICLTSKRIKNRKSSKVLNVLPVVTVPNDTIFVQRNYWYTLSDTIIAQGNEKFITIGNFYNDKETKYITLDISEYGKVIQMRIKENKIAYYYVDMVVVELIE